MSPQQPETATLRHERATMDEFVGRRIFHLMWDKKLTQTAFGRMVNIDQSSLAKKLRGQRGWSLDEIRAVAIGLDTTIAYLFGETSDPTGPGREAKPSD